ncbi:thioredoxin family protein [Candidatus Cytomitobacter primus]|nr:thioredoxin family protein [Candidatus Cytomitobacter primus]
MHKVIAINAENINKLTEASECIVDFWAEWCQPCLNFMPTFEEVSNDFNIPFFKINIDDMSSIAQNYAIRSIPTLIILKKGEEEARHSGSMSSTDLSNWIKTII